MSDFAFGCFALVNPSSFHPLCFCGLVASCSKRHTAACHLISRASYIYFVRFLYCATPLLLFPKFLRWPRSSVCCGCSVRLMQLPWRLMGGVQLWDFRCRKKDLRNSAVISGLSRVFCCRNTSSLLLFGLSWRVFDTSYF